MLAALFLPSPPRRRLAAVSSTGRRLGVVLACLRAVLARCGSRALYRLAEVWSELGLIDILSCAVLARLGPRAL